MGVAVCVWLLVAGGGRALANIQSNIFTQTLSLGGDISEFFDVSGNPLPGVCVSNSAAPAIPGQTLDANGNSTVGLAKSPMGVLGSQTGQYHPSGFNQRRVIAAYNPHLFGGTIYVGVDLPGGSGTAANPDYMDPLTCGGTPPCPTSTSPPIQRGSIRPFDSDGNGEPQSIGRMADGVTPLANCSDVTSNSIVDLFTCSDPSGASGATDDPSDSSKNPGAKEDYALSIVFTNGTGVTVDFYEDNSTASGMAALTVTPSTFGVMASKSTPGLGAGTPLGFDVEFAITNVNANVDPCALLKPTVVVVSGSNADGPAQGEDTEILRMQYVLAASVQCQVLLYTNNVQVVTNLCGQTAFAGVSFGDAVETRIVVTAGAGNAQNLTNISVSDYIGNVTNTVVIPGPLAPGQSVTNSLGSFTCDQPGFHGVMAVVNALGDVTASCEPIMSSCDSSFECCGMPGIAVEKLVACRPANGACALVSNYGKVATGTVTQAQSPAFCYSILVTNTGDVTLQLVSVVDNVLGNLSSFYPTSLAPNTAAVEYFVGSYTNDIVNSVTVTGSAVVAESVTTNVVATDNAMVHVVPASISCEKLVSTNGTAFSDHVSVLADGSAHDVTYEVTVTAGTNSPLTNVTITDPTLALLSCPSPTPFSLAAGAQTNIVLCTVPIICTSVADTTNTITVSANVDSTVAPFICALDSTGQPISVSSSCSAVVSCVGTSSITVVKNVICQPGSSTSVVGGPPTPSIVSLSAACDSAGTLYDGQKSVTAVDAGGQCPTFCYRIIVTNNGQLPLHNVSVNDSVFGSVSGPFGLPAGSSITNFFSETLCTNTQNTVTASGLSPNDATVSATDNASVTVKNASVSCSKQVSTDGVNFASSASIPKDGNAHQVIYKLTVQNTSDSGVVLNGLSVSDPNGCLGSVALPTNLASSASFTILCTNQLNCASLAGGMLTNTAVVSALVSSQGGTVCSTTGTVSSSCSAVVSCIGTSSISVVKNVICSPGTVIPLIAKPQGVPPGCNSVAGGLYDGQKTATGVAAGGLCPSFCYRVIVTNNGQLPLNNVNISDSVFGTVASSLTLAVGASETNFFQETLCTSTQNVVTATGVGTDSATVSATDNASVTVKNAGVSCTELVSTDGVSFASSATIPQDGNAHQVIYKLTVQNASDSGVALTSFLVSDLNGCLGSATLPTNLASSASFTILCTNQLNCANMAGGTLTDTAVVFAQASSQNGLFCVSGGSVSSSCSAVVNCLGKPAINVVKDVLCQQGTVSCSALGSAYDGQKTASSFIMGSQCPVFCYRIIVQNTGQLPLHGVTVTDPLFGGALGGYPTTLAVGASATNFFSALQCTNYQNTVVAQGIGSDSSTVTASASASVTIGSGGLSCMAIVYSPDDLDGVTNDDNVSLPSNYTWHQVTFSVVVSAGGINLTNVNVVANTKWDTCKAAIPFLAAGTVTNITLCSAIVSCDYQGEIFTNLTTVTGDMDTGSSQGLCGVSTNGEVTVSSQCPSYIQCLFCPTCSIQGPSYVCSNNSNQIYTVTSTLPGASIQWSIENAAIIVGSSTGTSVVVTPSGNPAIQYDVFATVAINGCTNTCKEWVGVSPAPSCMITPSSINANPGDTVSFTVAPTVGPGVPTISWTGPNGFTSNSLTITLQDVQAVNAGIYAVNIVDGNGCTTICQASLGVDSQLLVSPQVITRTQDYWKTHAKNSDASSLTLLKAIEANGGRLNLGFVCLPTGDVNGDGKVDSQDALSEALGLLWGPRSGNALCAARKQFAVQMITAIANNALFSTTKGESLIARARATAACGDTKAILAVTAELSAFNLSGNSAKLPNGLKASTADPKGAKKLQVAIPSAFCTGLNNCLTGHACP